MSLKNFLLSKVFVKNLGLAITIVVGTVMVLLIWLNFYTRHGQSRTVPNFIGLTIQQTEKLARKNRLVFHVVDSVYTPAVPAGCVAEQNPKPGFKVKKWRDVAITINAFSPEMVAMPNLVDLPKRQALMLIVSSGLQIGQLEYRPDLSIDVVIGQQYNGRSVTPGDSIQKGSVVDLVLGKGLSNQRTPVPNLVGMKLNLAKETILGSSLNLGTYIYDNTVLNNSDTLNAFVFKQNPEYHGDATLQLGSAIYLWLTVDPFKKQADSTDVRSADSLQVSDTGNIVSY